MKPEFLRKRSAFWRQSWLVSELERTAADYATRLKSQNALWQPDEVLQMWAEKQRTLERAASIMRGRLMGEANQGARRDALV